MAQILKYIDGFYEVDRRYLCWASIHFKFNIFQKIVNLNDKTSSSIFSNFNYLVDILSFKKFLEPAQENLCY